MINRSFIVLRYESEFNAQVPIQHITKIKYENLQHIWTIVNSHQHIIKNVIVLL